MKKFDHRLLVKLFSYNIIPNYFPTFQLQYNSQLFPYFSVKTKLPSISPLFSHNKIPNYLFPYFSIITDLPTISLIFSHNKTPNYFPTFQSQKIFQLFPHFPITTKFLTISLLFTNNKTPISLLFTSKTFPNISPVLPFSQICNHIPLFSHNKIPNYFPNVSFQLQFQPFPIC